MLKAEEMNVMHANIEVLKAIAHPLRLQILNFIHQEREVNVNKIYNALKLEQSITSQHLKIMREAGVVICRKKERFVYYAIEYAKVNGLAGMLQRMVDEA